MKISVDDGCASDVRMAELASRYGIETIFYWPVEWHSLAYSKGYEPLNYKDAREISNNHEIGSHSITHRHLTQIPEHEAKYEIETSKKILEDMLMVKINKFAPPRGYTNETLTKFTELFYEKQRLTKEEGLIHIHPDSGANNNMPWRDCITIDTKELFCHSWELDKYNLWEEVEDLLKEIKNHERS
jgi:peptidoglycan-N-acetylglucosamine deacetylase